MTRLLLFTLSFLINSTVLADQLTQDRAELIVESIIEDQSPNNIKYTFRSGLFQLTQNSTDAVNLNEPGYLPFFGFEGFVNIIDNFGLEARFQYAQNFLLPSSTPERNGTGAYQMVYDLGARYTWILDPTRTENHFVFKFMFHSYSNNFEVFDSDDETNKGVIYVESYRALLGGIERSFYVTPIITVIASLDGLLITNLSSDSVLQVDQQGLGFQIRGEAFLDLSVVGVPGRLGGAYWQGAYTNQFKDVNDSDIDAETTGKASHVQAFRAVSVSYSLLF